MPLEFPSSPVDGQVYDNWVYSSSKGAWLAKPLEPTTAVTSDTPPANPIDGDMWFNTVDGTTYVWYDDGNTAQWVEMVAPISANGYYSPNYIINGAFEINQRAFTSVSANAYGFDRFAIGNAGGTVTYSAQTFTPGAAPVAGYEGKNFARLAVSGQSAVGDYLVFYQPIEDVRTLAGKTVTFSFWAKAASGTPKIALEFYRQFGTGGSASDSTPAGQVTISTSWQRYSVTATIPSVAGKTIGPNSAIVPHFWFSGGSNYNARTGSLGIQANTFDIWGVQIEEGSTVTPFRRNANSLQGELAACQRYYFRISPESEAYTSIGNGAATSATSAAIMVVHPVPLRTRAWAVEYNALQIIKYGTSGTSVSTLSLDTNIPNRYNTLLNITMPSYGVAAGDVVGLIGNNNTAAYLGLSAEL